MNNRAHQLMDNIIMLFRRYQYIITLFLLMGIAPVLHSGGMPIAANGKGKAVIVLPDAPSPVACYAADELQWHIQKATGAKLEVIPERNADAFPLSGKIYVGPCEQTKKMGITVENMPPNAFRIKSAEAALFLVGVDGNGTPPFDDVRPMGTLFAAYEWLDTQAGVKWLWPGETGIYIPKTDSLGGGSLDLTKNTPFIHTKLRYGGGPLLGQSKGIVDPDARSKFMRDTAVFLRRHGFARPVSFEYGHAYEKYWDRFGKTHPEWFAMRSDGIRAPIDAATSLVQMCVSNPGLHKQIVADWLNTKAANPDFIWINGAENDRRDEDKCCSCKDCRAWDPKNPQILNEESVNLVESDKAKAQKKMPSISLSDRYAKFWLALQAEGKKHDPNATVVGYAYGEYSEPPLETKLNKNIIVWIVPNYRFPLTPQDKEHFKKIWDGWNKTGARLVLRPNYFWEGACVPYIFAHQFGDEFKYAYDNGLVGTDFDSLTSMWGTQGTNLYMLARIHDKPEIGVSKILDEYYSGFGAAAPQVKKYFDLLENVTSEKATPDFYKKHTTGSWASFLIAADKIYTPDVIEKARQILTQAASAVKGDSDAEKKVEFLKKGLLHTELELKTITAFNKYKAGSGNVNLENDYIKSLRELDKYRKSIEKDNVVDSVYLNWLETQAGWEREKINIMGRYEKIAAMPLFWKFQWDPTGKGESEKWFNPDFDDSKWLSARTDNPWEQQDVGQEWKKKTGKDYDGLAWYRNKFVLPKKAETQKILLLFGAVDESCKVWLNGELILERKFNAAVNANSWQEPFLIDISSKARRNGSQNILVVEVEDLYGNGGIWKPVSILAE